MTTARVDGIDSVPALSPRVIPVYLALTVLVWGLFAFDRGFWQDEVSSMGRVVAQIERGQYLEALFAPGPLPTRRLQSFVYVVAAHAEAPLLVLTFLYGVAWLGLGVLSERIARELFPDRPVVGYVAGALTLCATSDFLTGSLVALGYNLSLLAYFGALLLFLRWKRSASLDGRLLLAVVLVLVSLWMTDGALTSAVLTPPLIFIAGARRRDWRLTVACLLWWMAVVPTVVLLAIGLLDPSGYGARAIVPRSWPDWLSRTTELVVLNFTPWRWAFERPLWLQDQPAGVVPGWIFVAASAAGTACFIWGLRGFLRATTRERDAAAGGGWPGVALIALMTVTANAALAPVHFSSIHYRTHVTSRVWASVLLAVLYGALCGMRRWRRWLAGGGAAAFVFLGVWGGIERQNYFLAMWRKHRVELASVIESVPSLSDEAYLILHRSRGEGYQALEASYLVYHWMTLMYGLTTAERVFLWAGDRASGCRAEPGRFKCWTARDAECVAVGRCPGRSIPFGQAVVLEYEEERGHFRLAVELPPEILGEVPGGASYSPESHIRRREPSARLRALLTRERFLARFLPP